MTRLAVAVLWMAMGQPVARASHLADAGVPCVSHRGEARPTGYGYRHVVILTSACKAKQVCDVSTDVNPEIEKVPIAPNETKEVVTFLEAPGPSFTPRVSCK